MLLPKALPLLVPPLPFLFAVRGIKQLAHRIKCVRVATPSPEESDLTYHRPMKVRNLKLNLFS